MSLNGRRLKQYTESVRKQINDRAKAEAATREAKEGQSEKQSVVVSKKNFFTSPAQAPGVTQSSDIDYFKELEKYARETLKMSSGQIALLHRNQCREQSNDKWTYILSWQENKFTGTGDTLLQAKKNAAKLAYDYVNPLAVTDSWSIADELKNEADQASSPTTSYAP